MRPTTLPGVSVAHDTQYMTPTMKLVAPSASRTPSAGLVDRAVGAYLGLAIGDALGATVEFLTPNEIRHQIGTHREICGGGWLKLKPGHVTDDTTMSLAIGQAILACGGQVDAEPIARSLDAWMRAKPVDIGNTVRRGLMEFRRTGITERSENPHDAGNGAAMRLLPVALATLGLPESAVALACHAQARITHHNPLSDSACVTLALMVQDLLYGSSMSQALRARAQTLAAAHPVFGFDGRRMENPSGYIVDTLIAVFQGLSGTSTFEACLVDVVNRGGDADTTGAIAGMLAGAKCGAAALPQRWLRALNAQTRQACEEQALALVRCSANV